MKYPKPKYNPDIHHRRSTRLKGYDYSQPGAYFITIFTKNRECLFGDIVHDEMVLNEFGRIVEHEWRITPEIRKEVELDCFQIMPNHFHAIILIIDSTDVRANGRSPLRMKPRSLSSLMAGFKSKTTKTINQLRKTPGLAVWHRNYYDHIIRNEESLHRLREYILKNPANWEKDKLFSLK